MDKYYKREKPIDKDAKAQNDLTIPKHRFDSVNTNLKELRQLHLDLMRENTELRTLLSTYENNPESSIVDFDRQLFIKKTDKALALAGAKNITAVRALLNFSKLALGEDGNLLGLDEQLEVLKLNCPYLFNNCEAFIVIPANDPNICTAIAGYLGKAYNMDKKD